MSAYESEDKVLLCELKNYLTTASVTKDLCGNVIVNDESNERIKAIRDGVILGLSEDGIQVDRIISEERVGNDLIELIKKIHSEKYVTFLQNSANISESIEILEHAYQYPNTSPETYVSSSTWESAIQSANLARMAAQILVDKNINTYALTRPPGHHAGHEWMGGFCYLNNALIAALVLRKKLKRNIGILDFDYHYGNGTADIVRKNEGFYFASIQCDRNYTYPFFVEPISQEKNILSIDFTTEPNEESYIYAIRQSLSFLKNNNCSVIVISVGFDICRDDPYGGWNFEPGIFKEIGIEIFKSNLPYVCVQEGGYALSHLSKCARYFIKGILNNECSEQF